MRRQELFFGAITRVAHSFATCALAAIALAVPLRSQAAEAAGEDASKSLARYVPGQDVVVYVEFAGFDTYADAWHKTSTYRLLNETSLGAMLEALGGQLGDLVLKTNVDSRLSGADLVSIVEQSLREGFVFAMRGKPGPEQPAITWAIRGAGKDQARKVSNRLIARLNNTGQRPKSVVKAGGREVSSVSASPAWSLAWWFEKEDLVFAMGKPELADAMIDTLEGDRASAADNAIRKEMQKAEGGTHSVGIAFVDFSSFQGMEDPKFAVIGLDGVKRLDARWSIQDEALQGELSIQAPSPRHGLIAFFDHPTFDRASMPPLPAGSSDFTVYSLNAKTLYDRLIEIAKLANPRDGARLDELSQHVQTATGLRLREDILGHLGPKMTFTVETARVAAPTNPFTGALMPILQSPKTAFVAEVDDAAAVGKVLDALVAHANQVGQAVVANAQREGGAPANGSKASRLVAEFRPLPGANKGYVLAVAPGIMPLPSGMRPTFVLGKSHLIVASSPEVAKQALALENQAPARLNATGALGQAIDRLPGHMVILNVNDPRDTLFPEVLANLPALVQMLGSAATAERSGGPARGPAVRKMLVPNQFRVAIDPDMIPPADALRKRLGPGWLAVVSDDQAVRIVSRESLPLSTAMIASTSAYPALVALLMPAVGSAREAAKRSQCTNNLKQIGLAFHNYHSSFNKFPPAAIMSNDGKPLLSWRVAILPYLDQQALYDQFHMDEPWDSPHNKQLAESMPAVFRCPSDPQAAGNMTSYRVFLGKSAAFEGKEGVGIQDFTDGTSNTILVTEAPTAVLWTKPDDIKFDPDPDKKLPNFMGKVHPGGFNTLFTDGSVRFIKNSVNEVVLRALITRNGGEVIDSNEF